MLETVGFPTLDALVEATVPKDIVRPALQLPFADQPMTETQFLSHMGQLASKNVVNKSFIGMGYHGTHTPTVILRNLLENPGWYTQYTPYQAEISQGRLESLLNFQTMVVDLTGMPMCNASLLDEATGEDGGRWWGDTSHCNTCVATEGAPDAPHLIPAFAATDRLPW